MQFAAQRIGHAALPPGKKTDTYLITTVLEVKPQSAFGSD
jgi:hypothetical protein